MSQQDVLGREMTVEEIALLEAYRQLLGLLERDLPPCAAAGVKEAVASLWQVVNDLALTDDRPRLDRSGG